ncbi:hypothetical protein BIW11_10198 [Tropilaelaps mercedesae]|uniref:Uncharacterized protein n=1 Tax=Tropilaelaps mercedesae TaxID=418985 RepID=A0A1V9XH29_9ACAR|nr:hypothetical protein BIW11_10198 [Tropilaelaps mercedesae]
MPSLQLLTIADSRGWKLVSWIASRCFRRRTLRHSASRHFGCTTSSRPARTAKSFFVLGGSTCRTVDACEHQHRQAPSVALAGDGCFKVAMSA